VVSACEHVGGIAGVFRRVEDPPSAWRCVEHYGSAWERVRRVGKLADPSRGPCRRVEAWTAADLFGSPRRILALHLWSCIYDN
jgi:hypothetical protein